MKKAILLLSLLSAFAAVRAQMPGSDDNDLAPPPAEAGAAEAQDTVVVADAVEYGRTAPVRSIDGGSGEIGDTGGSGSKTPSYAIAYDILSQLLYNSTGKSIVSGEVEIAYDDLIEHTAKRVRVVVDRGYPIYEYM